MQQHNTPTFFSLLLVSLVFSSSISSTVRALRIGDGAVHQNETQTSATTNASNTANLPDGATRESGCASGEPEEAEVLQMTMPPPDPEQYSGLVASLSEQGNTSTYDPFQTTMKHWKNEIEQAAKVQPSSTDQSSSLPSAQEKNSQQTGTPQPPTTSLLESSQRLNSKLADISSSWERVNSKLLHLLGNETLSTLEPSSLQAENALPASLLELSRRASAQEKGSPVSSSLLTLMKTVHKVNEIKAVLSAMQSQV